MKKIATAIAAMVMVVGLTACNGHTHYHSTPVVIVHHHAPVHITHVHVTHIHVTKSRRR